jgi:translation initiation factor 4A
MSETEKTQANQEQDAESSGNHHTTIERWDDLECRPELLRGIYAYGFENPSPIQKKAIVPMIKGRDIIAQAQSGTGKTGCFTIGMLEGVDPSVKNTQALILSPTRELSQQTQGVVDRIGSFLGVKTQLLVGGTSTEADANKLLSDTPHIVAGCPGRVHDMLRRKKLVSSNLKLIILDEADEMLSSGFKEQVYNIFQFLPNTVQVALFSATMPSELSALTDKFMRDPVRVLVKAEQLTLEGIKQFYIALDDDSQKYDTLKDLYSALSVSQGIIYCNSVRRVQDLYDAMTADGFPVCQIHSSMEKEDRDKSYQAFKTGQQRILISSNVTARGIDVQQVSTVINFDIPKDVHTYLHRIGRSGRWGRKGLGINFLTRRENRKMKEIEEHYHTQIEEFPSNWASFVQT